MQNSLGFKNDLKEGRVIDIISHLFFALLIILAVLYREERLLSDASYYFFRVVNNESFWVEHDRYILIFSQIAPWVGSNLGLDLSTIVLLSSVGHVCFFYTIYLVTRYVYKDIYAGLILLSIQLLGITSGYFVPIFEFYYAMGFLVLFYVIFNNSKNKFKHFVLLILAFFIITAHFYAIVLFIYALLLYAFEKKDFKIKKYIPYTLLIVLFVVFKFSIISDYEKSKTTDFLYSLRHNVYDFAYLKSWLSFILSYYWDWATLILITVVLMILKKKYLVLLGYSVFLIGLIIMVNVSSYGFDLSRYKEQVNFSLMFLAGFTLIYFVSLLSRSIYKYILIVLVSTIFIFRFCTIWKYGKQYSSRLGEMKEIIATTQKKEGTKFIIDQKGLVFDANWSYPIESLIFSSIHQEKCASIVTEDDFYFLKNNEKIKPSEYLFRRWEVYDISRLNPRYFKLSLSKYSSIDIQSLTPIQ
ncbi:MAG: hypothetical protein COA32_01965 [Fluviicola sp.]|nr:MAG: hypothetical protein COA32_01965 [Fluviicola sp.]